MIPLRHQLDVGGARRVRRALAGVDVVHAQDRRAGLWTRLLPPAGAARVYTVHGLPEPYLPPPAGSERPGLRARVAYRGVDALLARRADAVITVSHAVERELVTRLGWPAERISVIPNGVELDVAPTPRGELVGTLTSFEPVKGLDVLLDAAAALPQALASRCSATGDTAALRGAREGARARRAGVVPRARAGARRARRGWPSSCSRPTWRTRRSRCSRRWRPACRSSRRGSAACRSSRPRGPGCSSRPATRRALAAAIGRLLDDPALARAQAEAARRHAEAGGGAAAMVERTLALYEGLLAR